MNNERLAALKDKLFRFAKLDDEIADAINLLSDIAQGNHEGWNEYIATLEEIDEADEDGEHYEEFEKAKEDLNLYHTDTSILYEILKS